MAEAPGPFVFHRRRRASLFFAPNQDALDSLREIEEWSALGSRDIVGVGSAIFHSSISRAVFPASDDSNCRNASHFRRSALDCIGKRFRNRRETKT